VPIAIVAVVVVAAAGTYLIYNAGHGTDEQTQPSPSASTIQLPSGDNSPSASASSDAVATATPSASPSPSASPTDTPLPAASLGQAKYPAGPELAPTLANETTGTATLEIDNLEFPNGSMRQGQTTEFPLVCSWTSSSSVRPAFLQRVTVLGENVDLYWSVGLGWDGKLGAYLSLTHGMVTTSATGGRADPGQVVFPNALVDPTARVQVARGAGSVTGSISGQVHLSTEVTAVGDVTADVSLTWDCGSAPTGVTGTPRPDPTGDAYEAALHAGQPPQVRSGDATLTPVSGCGGTRYDAAGNAGWYANCAIFLSPIPEADGLRVAAGSSIDLTTPGEWIPWPASITYVPVSAIHPDPDTDEIGIPAGSPVTSPTGIGEGNLTYPAPESGSYYAFVSLRSIDNQGFMGSYTYYFRVTVGK
jgi:hypothetical protein